MRTIEDLYKRRGSEREATPASCPRTTLFCGIQTRPRAEVSPTARSRSLAWLAVCDYPAADVVYAGRADPDAGSRT